MNKETLRRPTFRRPLSAGVTALTGLLLGCSAQPHADVDTSRPHIVSVSSPTNYGLHASPIPGGGVFKGERIDVVFSGFPRADSAPIALEAAWLQVVNGKCGGIALSGVTGLMDRHAPVSRASSAGEYQAQLLLPKYGTPDEGRCAAVYAIVPGKELVFLGDLQQAPPANNPEYAWRLAQGVVETPQPDAIPASTA